MQVRPRGLERAFIILPERHVTDRLLMRAHLQVTVYQYRHPEDEGNVELWLFPDGQRETRSAARGITIGSHVPTLENVRGDEHLTKRLFELIAAVAPSSFPEFGRVRVIEWAAL